MIDRSEVALKELGFRIVRVRHHDEMARIEVAPEEMPRFLDDMVHNEAVSRLTEIGYRYVTLDLKGYRSGSLNEALEPGLIGIEQS